MIKKKEIKEMKKKINEFNGLNPTSLLHPVFKIPRTFGQKAADWLTKWAGSWLFIILLFVLIATWIYLNITAYVKQWDPWPFIILNLCLSCLAAIQAPIILMSQNRQAQKDRLKSEYDYKINKKAEKEIQRILRILEKKKS